MQATCVHFFSAQGCTEDTEDLRSKIRRLGSKEDEAEVIARVTMPGRYISIRKWESGMFTEWYKRDLTRDPPSWDWEMGQPGDPRIDRNNRTLCDKVPGKQRSFVENWLFCPGLTAVFYVAFRLLRWEQIGHGS